MTEYIIASIIGLLQIVISIYMIIKKKNILAIVTEIISSLTLLYILNASCIGKVESFWNYLLISLEEYILVKVFLVFFMWGARYYSFCIIKHACRNKKKLKQNSKKLKIVRSLYNAKYWPNEKLGNPAMANKIHEKTKVRFDSRGFPRFQAYYTVKLKRSDFRKTREQHFDKANKMLYQYIIKQKNRQLLFGKKLKVKFSRKQIEELKCGETPNGFVWHHHQNAGVLQLIDEEIHAKTAHIGGFSIWGGNK